MRALDRAGYSLPEGEERDSWLAAVAAVRRRVSHPDAAEELLFHGTSSTALEGILSRGLEPTEIELARLSPGMGDLGSFWGSFDTALAYAEDTACERHPGSRPVVLAVSSAWLERECLLGPDGATLDFPLAGLSRLDDPAVVADWAAAGAEKSWRDGLRDLSAVVAAHDFVLPAHELVVVASACSLDAILGGTRRSPRA